MSLRCSAHVAPTPPQRGAQKRKVAVFCTEVDLSCKRSTLLVFSHRQRLVQSIVWPTPSLTTHPKLTQPAAWFLCDSWATCYDSTAANDLSEKKFVSRAYDRSASSAQKKFCTHAEVIMYNLTLQILEYFHFKIGAPLSLTVLFALRPMARCAQKVLCDVSFTDWLRSLKFSHWHVWWEVAPCKISRNPIHQ